MHRIHGNLCHLLDSGHTLGGGGHPRRDHHQPSADHHPRRHDHHDGSHTTTTLALTYTGIAGVVIGEGEDFTGGTMTCHGLQADDGQAYNLAIGPDTGLQWGALVTADGERVRGGTSKEVVGADIEDIETGEAVVRAGDYVEVTAESPPSGASQCDLPVLSVVSISPLD